MRKLWLDTETTGLDAERHTIVQIAAICEGEEFHVRLDRQPGTRLSAGALMVNNLMEISPDVQQDPLIAGIDFLKFLKSYYIFEFYYINECIYY